MDDTISFMCCAMNVQPEYEVDGELLVGAKYLYFIATRICKKNVSVAESDNACIIDEKNYIFLGAQVTIAEADKYSLIVKFSEIKEIHNRRFQLKERAIELFLMNGRTVLIAFSAPMVRVVFRYAISIFRPTDIHFFFLGSR